MKEKIINIVKIIILFAAFFGLNSLIQYLLIKAGADLSQFSYSDNGYYDAFIETIFAILVILFYQNYLIKDSKDFKKNPKENTYKLLKYIIILFVIKIGSAIVTALLYYIFIGGTYNTSENQKMVNLITDNSPVLMVISAVFLAPIVEEGIFRLGLHKVIKNKWLFIIISGLIFGLMHVFPVDNISLTNALIDSITYITIGITFAYIYAKTDNIWFTILIHFLNNLIGMIAIFL